MKITIGGNLYEVSPLRCKHLKQLSTITGQGDVIRGTYADLERFAPYITFSLQQKQPEFTQDMLEDATLQEFLDAWNAVISCSGIKFVTSGEKEPERLSGESSTQESASLPAGRTLQ